ncbi:MAG: gliding motility-associated C-terminal domain-containing protein [bacterium]
MLLSYSLHAQISAPTASRSILADYPVSDETDSVFIFNRILQAEPSGSLLAVRPGAEDSCSFTWYKYDVATSGFNIIVEQQENDTSSFINNLEEGGYRVFINKPGQIDTFFTAWVYLNNISVSVNETEDGKIEDNKYTCSYVDLEGEVKLDTFTYFDPSNDSLLRIIPRGWRSDIVWSSFDVEGNSSEFLYSEMEVRNFKPPYYDTWFVLTVTDEFGARGSDSVFYETIQTKAEFSMEYQDEYDEFVELEQNAELSAPALVRFSNMSVNGAEFEWTFTDTTFSGEKPETEFTVDSTFQPEHTYYIPRSYIVTLVSKSTEQCTDTFRNKENPILVQESFLDVPNVFTPDASTNSVFIIKRDRQENIEKFASIRDFRILIFNRWGRKVYEYEGDINNWEGWNGGINNNRNRPASAGVYYYVIEAIGFDDREYKGERFEKKYAGFLYLFR